MFLRRRGGSNWTKTKQKNWDSSTNQLHLFRGSGRASHGKWYLEINVKRCLWIILSFVTLDTWKDFTFLSLNVTQGLGLVTILPMGCECNWHVPFPGQSKPWLVWDPAFRSPAAVTVEAHADIEVQSWASPSRRAVLESGLGLQRTWCETETNLCCCKLLRWDVCHCSMT